MTFTGSFVNGDCISNNNGNAVDAGGPCTIGGGGGTVTSGTANQLAYYAANGTAVGGLSLGTGVFAALSKATNGASGLVTQDANGRINNFTGAGGDWLATYAYGQTSAGVFLGAVNDDGIAGAARTSTNTAGGSEAVIGSFSWGFADGGTYATNPVWGSYAECRAFSTSSTGFCAGQEIDITNFKSGTQPIVTDPYNSEQAGATYGLHIGSGGGCQNTVTPNTPCYDPISGLTNLVSPNAASSAITISSNSGTRYGLFNNGIVFSCGSIGSTDCSGNGFGNALVLYSGLKLQWFSPSNLQTFQIYANSSRTGGALAWESQGFFMSGENTASSTGNGVYLCIDTAGFIYQHPSCP